MGQKIALLWVGAAVGFGLGWFAAPRGPALTASTAVTASRPSAEPNVAPASAPVVAAPSSTAAAVSPRVGAALEAARAEEQTLRVQNAKLVEQVTALQAQLTGTARDAGEAEPPRFAPPANLDPRFSTDALVSNLNDLFHQAGFADAQVTSVDCSEYPCIAFGEGMGSRDDFQKLRKATRFGPYKDDGVSQFGWGGSAGPDGKPSYHFGVAFFPTDDPNTKSDAFNDRLGERAQQMGRTFRNRQR